VVSVADAVVAQVRPRYAVRICTRPGEDGLLQRFLAIDAMEHRTVVCLVQLLSPDDKRDCATRRAYLAAREGALSEGVNLVEIDLLRGGLRIPLGRPSPPTAYWATASRASLRPRCEAWAIGLRDRLPTIVLPLGGGEQARLDLQAALDAAFDRSGWAYSIHRGDDPVPPLDPDDLAWARALLAKSPPTSP
jgi:hypothetical protein